MQIKNVPIPFCYLIGILLLQGGLLIDACQFSGTGKSDPDIERGKQLARQYCSSCHSEVLPDVLNKDTWVNHVLPAMAPKLGIRVWRGRHYYSTPEDSPVISYMKWLKIVEYYEKTAPQKLPVSPPRAAPLKDWAVFRLKKPSWKDTAATATTSMVAIDTINRQIFSGDATDNNLYCWNRDLKRTFFANLPSAAVHAYFNHNNSNGDGVFTCIGTINAVDYPVGKIVQFDLRHKKDTAQTIASGLPRPVQAIPADLDKDGLTDWVVCGFGHNEGGLYAFLQTNDHRYRKISIREVPGAEQAVTGDFNQDGWPDIMALFAHADEGIWLFLNNRKGGFTASNLLHFPPVYGSTGFQLTDFNHDGLPDILYTCGDNADYSKILKPFHGVYIFLNQGGFRFKQAWFYPVNGCTKARAADFDGDGDLDIVSIAFFADLQHDPAEKFIYFEQDAPMHFVPHAVPVQNYGRWICMDVNDLDGDGDPDIVLGNYSRGFINQPGFKPDWNTHLPLIVLENTTNNLPGNTGKHHR